MSHPRNAACRTVAFAAGLCVVLVLAACDHDDDDHSDTRIVYGVVDDSANVLAGSGFTADHPGTGGFRIYFDSPFATAPAITVTALWDDSDRSAVANLRNAGTDQFDVRISTSDFPATLVDRTFHFVAVGPR